MNASAVASVAESLSLVAEQDDGDYGDLTYILFNATLGVLIIDPTITNIDVLSSSVLGDLLSRKNFVVGQLCTFPISGAYGFLNRLLYYCLLLFALLVRHSTWLCPAALGAAMTYSVGACVHTFALLAHYKFNSPDLNDRAWYREELPELPSHYGDIDLAAILPVLIAGSVTLAPILNWSYTLRRLPEGSKAVVILWGVLMYAATISSFLVAFKGIFPFVVGGQVAYCPVGEDPRCSFDAVSGGSLRLVSLSHYNLCHCKSTCGVVSPDHAPLRKGSNLQALLLDDALDMITRTNSYTYVAYVDEVFLSFIIAHGVFGVVEARWTQARVRNGVFRFLNGTTSRKMRTIFFLGSPSNSILRYYAAKFIASMFFGNAILAAIICPPLFVGSLIINELALWNWPVSEDFDAMGQWTPWVTAACVIIAAIIQHRDAIFDYLKARLLTRQGFRRVEPSSDELVSQRHSLGIGSSVSLKVVISRLINAPRLLVAALDLQGFRYWFMESSLHDQSNYGPSKHNSFLACDKCKQRGTRRMYECTDCDQRYCATCWKQKQRLGAKLQGCDRRSSSKSEILLDNLEFRDTDLFPDMSAFQLSRPEEPDIENQTQAPGPLLILSPSPDEAQNSPVMASSGQNRSLPTETIGLGAERRHGHQRRNTDDSMCQYQIPQHFQSTDRLLPVRNDSRSPSPASSTRSQRSNSNENLGSVQSIFTSPPKSGNNRSQPDVGRDALPMITPPASHLADLRRDSNGSQSTSQNTW